MSNFRESRRLWQRIQHLFCDPRDDKSSDFVGDSDLPDRSGTRAGCCGLVIRIRGMKPPLVIPAVPLPSLSTQQEVFIAEYEWVLN